MRPVHLIIDGLACFRDRQEIDFASLDLFAISGPTGAGKSTILDAIVLALYGNVPRVGKDDRAEMIAASRDRASVVLEFEAGSERYRIARALKRTGPSSVSLERVDAHGKGAVSLGDQVRIVDAKVEQILGLDVNAFKQAVVLPQGEFAAFLKAVPGDRRRMLRSLLRLEVYETMRIRASQAALEKKTAIDNTRGLLAQEYAGVSAEALAALEARAAERRAGLDALRRQRSAEEAELTVTRSRHDKSRALEKAGIEARLLEARAADMERVRQSLERAGRAAEILPAIEEAERAGKAAGDARMKAARAAVDHEVARRAAEGRAAALREAEAALLAVPELRERIEVLNRIVGRLPELARLEGEIARLTRAVTSLVAERKKLRADLEAAVAKQKAEHDARAVAQAAAAAADYDAAEESLLSGLRGRASALSADRRSLAEATSRMERDRAATGAASAQAASYAEKARKSREAAEVARRDWEAAEASMHAAHRLDAANGLRHSLVAGDACPVCEQTVAVPPPATLTPEVESAVRARDLAKKRLDAAEATARQAETAQARAEADREAAEAALVAASEGVSGLAARVEAESAALVQALGDRRPGGDARVEVWIEERAMRLLAARDAHARAMEERRRAEHAIELARATENAVKAAIAEKESSGVAIESDLHSANARHAALRAEITAAVESGDPEAEVTRLGSRVKSLEEAHKRAAEEASPAAVRLAAAAEAERQQTEAARIAAEHAADRARIRDVKVSDAGFADPADVRAARLEPAVIESRARELESWERGRHAARTRVAELEGELGDARVTDVELSVAEDRFNRLKDETERASADAQALELQAASLRARLERSAAMRAQLEADEAEYRIQARLATDLKSDQFQAYVLEEAFSELVQGAATRLLALTEERYSLVFRDDQILVVDNDNAGETRISDTLSGGETFLASLSLALELSAQVQRAAGAVNLDSLFIDEGFGTLDPDTLALVAETIQGLQAGGRMVGIITHIPELRDEFAQQILVTKREGFSTVEVRAGN